MKQTGVVRKIDELGRIVLPKEIRRTLGIRDGENLEIFVDEKGVYLQKFSKLWDLKDMCDKLCQIVKNNLNLNIIIANREKIISSSITDALNIKIDNFICELMENREEYKSTESENFLLNSLKGYFIMKPIIVNADCLGMIILFKENTFLNWEEMVAGFLKDLFIHKIEI